MILKNGNVERIAKEQGVISKLESLGFKPLKEEQCEEQETIGDIAKMETAELKALAKEKGIEGADSLTKKELLAVLKDVI